MWNSTFVLLYGDDDVQIADLWKVWAVLSIGIRTSGPSLEIKSLWRARRMKENTISYDFPFLSLPVKERWRWWRYERLTVPTSYRGVHNKRSLPIYERWNITIKSMIVDEVLQRKNGNSDWTFQKILKCLKIKYKPLLSHYKRKLCAKITIPFLVEGGFVYYHPKA